jgi:methionyl-tRNA synthetase
MTSTHTSKSNTFFVTTPIYYPNGIPHIGHAYSSFIADTLARYHRNIGEKVRFSTGVDENSQKIVDKANELGKPVMEYLDEMSVEHKKVWDGIGISYTDFVRTTHPNHAKLVQEVLQKSFDNGDIYAGVYEGLYCKGCEGFKKPNDLVDGKCPDHPNGTIEHLNEKNYFFRLSKYEQTLKDLYASQSDFVTPENRFQEVIEFVNQWLEDFSISRETNKFGIPLPFDPEQVTYVWYDALFNYVSILWDEVDEFWPANVHVVGKDIIRFHAIFWPAMLLSAGYAVPKQVLATGHFTIEGQKISKSLGNVIDPVEFSGRFNNGRDLLLNYLFSAFQIGQDGDFSEKEAILAFNNRLANTLGNLLNRFIVLSLVVDGNVPKWTLETEIAQNIQDAIKKSADAFEIFELRTALLTGFELAENMNKYIDTKKPWELKDPSQFDDLRHILYQVGESLRVAWLLLSPFFPAKMEELLNRIGASSQKEKLKDGIFSEAIGEMISFSVLEKGEPLYMRIVIK